jgi:hypothetical protein
VIGEAMGLLTASSMQYRPPLVVTQPTISVALIVLFLYAEKVVMAAKMQLPRVITVMIVSLVAKMMFSVRVIELLLCLSYQRRHTNY